MIRKIIKKEKQSTTNIKKKKKKTKKFLRKKNINFLDRKENKIGNPIIYNFLTFKETGTNIQNNWYYSVLKNYINKLNSKNILEIGGGFGKLASKFIYDNPKIDYSIIELPYTAVTAYYYLREFFENHNQINMEFYFDKNQKINSQKNLSIFTNNYIKNNNNIFNNIDVAINTQSLMHMSESEILFYVKLIKKNNIKNIISINRLQKKRDGEAEFNKIFVKENIKLLDKVDLDYVDEDMHLTLYENLD